jgi:aspartyl-tRNA(Asn)/glutamyl-tRNA(Gln) amidotransferase subunit A
LSNFFSNKNAAVIDLLTQKGYKLLGKTALDEFACGGTGLSATTGPLFNPYNSLHITGGSSSGSSIIVAKKIVPFALGHDTGDSVRRPASYCGIVGFKPSYGLISRSGLIPMASSLDTVGILANKVDTVKEIFSLLNQPDPADLITNIASIEKKKPQAFNHKKIAVIENLETILPNKINEFYCNVQKRFEKLGYDICKVKIPKKIRENLQIIYLIICSTELLSHLNSLQGITYGPSNKNTSIAKKRSKGLGKTTKERLLFGIYFLSEGGLLEKAQKMRYLVSK